MKTCSVLRAACDAKRVAHSLIPLLVALLLTAGVEAVPAQMPETVCLQCHGKQAGRFGAPVGAWRSSIHAANGISCHNCHGGDPSDMAMAMRPERGFLGAPKESTIPEFCGRCHVGVKEDYLASAHGRALGRGGPQCVTCHSNHAVRKATPDLINSQSCSRCHDYGRAEEIKASVVETDRRITELEQSLAGLRRTGITTVLKIECTGKRWWKGYLLEVDDGGKFRTTLESALEHYRSADAQPGSRGELCMTDCQIRMAEPTTRT